MKNNNFLTILIGVLIFVILILAWRTDYLIKQNQKDNDEYKKYIISKDSLLKESDGRYSKLVDYYNTEKDLKNELKKSNEELYKVIRKQGERILSLTNVVVSLEGKINEGTGYIDKTDTNKINLSLRYPEEKNPFITWNGSVDRTTAFYKGEWVFGKLPLQIVLTEEKRGLWKTRFIGPDWFKVDSLTINSLPPEQYTPKENLLNFLIGGGYIKSLDPTRSDGISVGTGLDFKNTHKIVLNTNTNKEVNINYYYTIKINKK
jgi:hypothetical protein